MANILSDIVQHVKDPNFSLEDLSFKDLLIIFRQSILKTKIVHIIAEEKELLKADKSPYQLSKLSFLERLEDCVKKINSEVRIIMHKLDKCIIKIYHQFKVLQSRKQFWISFKDRLKAVFVDDLIAQVNIDDFTIQYIGTSLYRFLANAIANRENETTMKILEYRNISKVFTDIYFFKNYGVIDPIFLEEGNMNIIVIRGIYEELNAALMIRNDTRMLPRRELSPPVRDCINILSFAVAFRIEMVIIENFKKCCKCYEVAVTNNSSIDYKKLRDAIVIVVSRFYSRNEKGCVTDAAVTVFENMCVVIDTIFNFWQRECKEIFLEMLKNIESKLKACLDRMFFNCG